MAPCVSDAVTRPIEALASEDFLDDRLAVADDLAEATAPLESLIVRLALQEREPSGQLLRLGERTVGHAELAAGVPDPRAIRAESARGQQHAGPFDVLVELAELAPAEPEVHGLVALMEIQASRALSRVSETGEPILLLDQDRARWDRLLIHRGLAALARTERLGGPAAPYVLQAAIAACHARAPTPADTDWARIVGYYDELARIERSPIVELNRAVAYGMAFGAARGLRLVDALTGEPSLAGYHLLPSVRGDLLAKLGRSAEAHAEFERAAGLAQNARERAFLLRRAAECAR